MALKERFAFLRTNTLRELKDSRDAWLKSRDDESAARARYDRAVTAAKALGVVPATYSD